MWHNDLRASGSNPSDDSRWPQHDFSATRVAVAQRRRTRHVNFRKNGFARGSQRQRAYTARTKDTSDEDKERDREGPPLGQVHPLHRSR